MKWFDRLRRTFSGEPDRSIILERALTLHESGNLPGAENIYASLLAHDPGDADALHLTGLIAHQRGQHERAMQLIAQAIARRPSAPRFHFNLGNALVGLDNPREAALSFQHAADLDPAHAPSWFNLGAALARLDEHTKAVAALRRAFDLAPELTGVRQALAQALINAAASSAAPRTAYADAADLLENHWQFADKPSDTRLLLAHALQESHQWTRASTHCRAMIEAFPDLEAAHNTLANCYNSLGRMGEARDQYREVLRLSPNNALAASGIVSSFNYDSEATPERKFQEHLHWAQRFAPEQGSRLPHSNSREFDRRLRLAYVSPDLRRHPVSAMFAPIIERHDRARFEVFCYYNYPTEDIVTQRIRAASDGWVDIHQWNDATVSRRIREDGIDILVDLAGHTSYGRLRAFASRPAPVQVSWLGYFSTTGLTQLDAFITDPHSSPPGQQALFSEKLMRLPDTRYTLEPHPCYPPVGPPRHRKPGAVIFGCLNNLAKINDQVLAAWSAILGQLPESRLLLQAIALEDAPNREAFLIRCEQAGIARARIELRPWVPLEESARTYHDIDIALDPFPFCGGMTSLDALWMAVPVVTLAGELVAGRQSASMLANVGLADLIVYDVDSYVALAVSLARAPARLDHLRANLRANFAASPLCDHDKFTRALEHAYLDLWRQWADGPIH